MPSRSSILTARSNDGFRSPRANSLAYDFESPSSRSWAARGFDADDSVIRSSMPEGFAPCEPFAKPVVRWLRDDLWTGLVHHRRMNTDEHNQWFLREWREYRGLSQERLAALAETSKGYISDMERGKRGHSREMAGRLAKALNVLSGQLYSENPVTGERRTPTVPLVGYVAAAGDEAKFYSDADALEYVEAPRDAGPDTVAMQIKGDSLGRWYSGWLVFFDDVRDPPSEDLFNQLCVIGLGDDRVVLKILKFHRGGFILESQNGDSITDAPVIWAAKVKGLSRR